MSFTRRQTLKAMVAAGAAGSLVGCEKIISSAADHLGQSVPDRITVPGGSEIDPAHHLLNRAGYGPWPGDVERVHAMGQEAWIEEQLEPGSINDVACDLRARRFESIHQSPGTCFEYDKPVLREEMSRHTLLRAVYSRRQLFEVMVAFWTDHLNINIEKGDCIYLKPADDREVIRKHALGTFRDLVRASVTSPAMLVYLDGNQNKRSKPDEVPNENYARELLELHTLGVHGGYAQRDVFEAARALTGWRVREGFRRGTVYFDPALHDDGEKTVLGQVIPAGLGGGDVDRLVEIVCAHPSTARFISTKLVRRFVADDPPVSLVSRAAEVFARTQGDIESIVRVILTSAEFKVSKGLKYKPPFRYVASCLRAVGADTHAHTPLIEYLNRMGQGVFQHPTPDGYPDEAAGWMGSLLWRWNLAYALAAGAAPSVAVDVERLTKAVSLPTTERTSELSLLFGHLVGRTPGAVELESLEGMEDRRQLVGTILSSPSFMRY